MKISLARLHQAAHIPGFGDMTVKFPPDNRTFVKFDMTRLDNGDLWVHAVYKPVSGEVTDKKFIIPAATVAVMVLSDEQ